MIRLRSAFLITLLATLLAFAAGVHAGYISSRASTLAEGIELWVNEMKFGAAETKDADIPSEAEVRR
jgi:hypothetical protein